MGTQRRWMCRLVLLMAVLCISGCFGGMKSYAAANGWIGDYFYVNDVVQRNTWVRDAQAYYYVDQNGHRMTGWKYIQGRYYFFNEEGKIHNSRAPIGARLSQLSPNVLCTGIDMSQWQGTVDWNKIKASGVRFVMLRLGYGKGRYGNAECRLDERFYDYVRGAKSVGIPVGIYFYSYAKNLQDAYEEAQFTIEHLDGVEVAFPVAYDLEDSAIRDATDRNTRTQMAKLYMDTLAAAGYTPMYYCNRTWYNEYLDKDALRNYEFWYARYTYVEPDRNQYNCGMWQATSTQRLAGVTENTVDLNFLYKNYLQTVTRRSKPLRYGWHKEWGRNCYYYQGRRTGNGWFRFLDHTYYMRQGVAYTGWQTISGRKYYFDSDGIMQTGFTVIGRKLYLFDDNGALQTRSNQQGIVFNRDGSCTVRSGWYRNRAGYYYRYANGQIAKNAWIRQGRHTYYCNARGYRVSGFQTIRGKNYCFYSNGVMRTGWLPYQRHYYYYWVNGEMVTNRTVRIGNRWYRFDTRGRLVR